MSNSWTTLGLSKSMRDLMKLANQLAANITKESNYIKNW